jgi:ribose 5-phosphate isomerase B
VEIVLGSDEETPVVDALLAAGRALGHSVERVALGEAWPEVGRAVGAAVARREADVGICCCHTGTGVTIAANKIPGVRAALCGDAATARGARQWNDANVLGIGLRQTSELVAIEILEAFLATAPDPAEAATIDRVEPR